MASKNKAAQKSAAKNTKSAKATPKAEVNQWAVKDFAFGTAKEQNEGYAKLAAKVKVGAQVQELNGLKRIGEVTAAAKKGSGYLEVRLSTDTVTVDQTKFIGDLKVLSNSVHTTRKSAKAQKKADAVVTVGHYFVLNDVVEHPTHGRGLVVKVCDTPDMYEVAFDKYSGTFDSHEVHANELTLVKVTEKALEDAKQVAQQTKFKVGELVAGLGAPAQLLGRIVETPEDVIAAGSVYVSNPAGISTSSLDTLVAFEKPVTEKAKKVRFEDILLLGAFAYKDKAYVKVGNTSAINTTIMGTPGKDNAYVMCATKEQPLPKDAKTRFRKADKVEFVV